MRIAVNERAAGAVKKIAAKSSEKEKQYQWVRALSNTANGALSGQDRIMLETYVQTAFFDRIIIRANTRFMQMTSGQFELVRAKTADNLRAQSGLELNVIDHYNGSIRSVKSLSGERSFKASLAMALDYPMKSSRRRVVSRLIQCLLMKGLAHWMKIHWNRRLMFYCGYRRATACGNYLPRRRIKGAYRAADCCYQDTGRRKPCQDCCGQLRTAVYFTASYKP